MGETLKIIIGIGSLIILFVITLFVISNLSVLDTPSDIGATQTILADNGTTTTLAYTPSTWTSATVKNQTWLSFDGVNDEIDLTDSINNNPSKTCFSLGYGGGNHTFSIWLNSSETINNPNNAIISNYQQGFYISHYNGKFFVAVTNGTSSSYKTNNVTSSVDINDSIWHLLTFTYNNNSNGNMTIYIDGNFDGSKATYGQPISDCFDELYLSAQFGTADFSKSYLDEFRYYNRTLSSTEIFEIYASGRVANSSLPTTGLVLWLPLNENSGIDVHSFNQSDFT